MAERPILFSGPMVRALLEGRKTMTRRVIKPQPIMEGVKSFGESWAWSEIDKGGFSGVTEQQMRAEYGLSQSCPYGQPGDRLWVRETHCIHNAHGQHRDDGKRWGPWGGLPTTVSPDGTQIAYYREGFDRCDPSRWRPSIHMPRWACRIVLEVVSVRVERLQDISEEDARAEGCPPCIGVDDCANKCVLCPSQWPREWFCHLWDSINAKRGHGWDVNPWAWVVEFKRVEA
ncbi:hypothetical protein [Desulfocurvibacter africanus]|uniref:Uncharacterized protein n=1 Tax=Desulfocurvibacter africanus subsp. africanus str. Walvis Bay TaxID=690850 RepID=F3Z333_DESAF|nr:hypothetical protein [Desulfocurvibacter africanus]EGJ50277.1 hypothetical protein Desaf_1948 [Desulfocurvibacter africanus subsp. africanus str. Walvis Bay]